MPDKRSLIVFRAIFRGGRPVVVIASANEFCSAVNNAKTTAAHKGKTYDHAHINDLYKAING